MAMALHVAPDHGAVEDIHRDEQRRRSVPLEVVCHRSGAVLLQRQSGLRAVQRLIWLFFVDRQDDGVRGRIDIEPDDVGQFIDKRGSLESSNWRIRCGWRPCLGQMRCTELTLSPPPSPSKAPVQCVAPQEARQASVRQRAPQLPRPAA